MGIGPEELKKNFDTARDQRDYDLLQSEIAVSQGQLDSSQVNLRSKFLQTGATIRESLAQKRKQANSTADFLRLMNMMDTSIAALEKALVDKYGEDYVNAIAKEIMTSEQLAEHETKEERLAFMFSKYLDENGKIKPEHKGDEKAKVVAGLYKIGKGKTLSAEMETLKARKAEEIIENGEVSEQTQNEIVELQAETTTFINNANYSEKVAFDNNAADVTTHNEAVESLKVDFKDDKKLTSSLDFSFS